MPFHGMSAKSIYLVQECHSILNIYKTENLKNEYIYRNKNLFLRL